MSANFGFRCPFVFFLGAFFLAMFPALARERGPGAFSRNTAHKNCFNCHLDDSLSLRTEALGKESASPQLFVVYSSFTLDAEVGQPSGVSKLCLSCHDGTIGRDSFRTTHGGAGSPSKLGSDLSNDHPISFLYDSELAFRDGHLFDPSITDSGLGGTIEEDLLVNGRVECTSCHEVHGTTGLPYLLVKPTVKGSLCLTCHRR